MDTVLHDIKGQCLCKKIEVSVKNFDPEFGACHCSTCRKWSGGPLLCTDCGHDVNFSDPSQISIYPSSEWAERGFCKSCGTHLFYRLVASGQYLMPIGLFENSDDLKFDHQIFIDEKPAYYDFSNDTSQLTGAEVFAAFTEDGEHE